MLNQKLMRIKKILRGGCRSWAPIPPFNGTHDPINSPHTFNHLVDLFSHIFFNKVIIGTGSFKTFNIIHIAVCYKIILEYHKLNRNAI